MLTTTLVLIILSQNKVQVLVFIHIPTSYGMLRHYASAFLFCGFLLF